MRSANTANTANVALVAAFAVVLVAPLRAADPAPAPAPAPASASTTTPSSTSSESAPIVTPKNDLPQGIGDVRPGGHAIGVGVSIGAPVGLAGKYYLNGSSALSFLLGFWAPEYGGLVLDYVFHPVGPIGAGTYGTPFLAVGGGVALGVGNIGRRGVGGSGDFIHSFSAFGSTPYALYSPGNFGADVHGTLGLGFSFVAPVDVFVEFSPGLLLLPELDIGTRLTIGSRFYF